MRRRLAFVLFVVAGHGGTEMTPKKKAKKNPAKAVVRATATAFDAPEGAYVEYHSNNSGGDWWLDTTDWLALERAGWYVIWGGYYFCRSKYSTRQDAPDGAPLCDAEQCQGHRRYTAPPPEDDRWLGASATYARRYGVTLGQAISEWERVTGKNSAELGCGCCGPPHSFSTRDAKGGYGESYSPDDVRIVFGFDS